MGRTLIRKSHHVEWNKDDPLQKIPEEHHPAHKALMQYALMGKDRSQVNLMKLFESTRNPVNGVQAKIPRMTTLQGWSIKYEWVARVQRWDEIQQEKMQQLWLERKVQVREADWEHGRKLRQLAADILAEAPEFVRESITPQDDGKVIIVKALDVHALEKIEALASKLERLAAEMETNRTDVTSAGKAIKVIGGIDLDNV